MDDEFGGLVSNSIVVEDMEGDAKCRTSRRAKKRWWSV
jgi:hypothetical protein